MNARDPQPYQRDERAYVAASAGTALMQLPITQREALIACVRYAALRRTRAGYRPSQPGIHAAHTTRAVNALVRAGLATYSDGEVEIQPTDAARALVAAAQATPTQRRSAAA